MTNQPLANMGGIERIRERVPAWIAALQAGRRAAIKCSAPTKTGKPCGYLPMRGTDRCLRHLRGKEREIYDQNRLAQWQQQAKNTNAVKRRVAERALRRIAKRQLFRDWKLDPRLPGSTLILSEHDEARAHKWLLQTHNVDLEALSPAGEPWTPRAIDRLRWCAHLALSSVLTPIKAKHRVILAGRDDVKFFEKLRLIEAGQWPPPKKRGGRPRKAATQTAPVPAD